MHIGATRIETIGFAICFSGLLKTVHGLARLAKSNLPRGTSAMKFETRFQRLDFLPSLAGASVFVCES
jgi:hypothetical protein